MKFVFFLVLENGENGLGDEMSDGGFAPRIFGLEPPLERGSNFMYMIYNFGPLML